MEGANKALAALEGDAGAGRHGSGGREEEAARAPANRALLHYLEAFVSDEFLPDVYIDFRHVPPNLTLWLTRLGLLGAPPHATRSQWMSFLRASRALPLPWGALIVAKALAMLSEAT